MLPFLHPLVRCSLVILFGDNWSCAFFVRWLRLAHFLFADGLKRRNGMIMSKKSTMNDALIINDGIVVGCDSSATKVVIPQEVTKIASKAFENSKMEEIVFKCNSLQSIENNAFSHCHNLEIVELPKGLLHISEHAFEMCPSLRCVYIPDSVLNIDDHAFLLCSNLCIVGKKGSLANKYADENNIPFSTNKSEVIDIIRESSEKRKNLATKTFDIFGESITCSNSLALYDELLHCYNKDRQTLPNAFMSGFSAKCSNPDQISSSITSGLEQMKKVQEIIVLSTYQDLFKQGVMVDPKYISLTIGEPLGKAFKILTNWVKSLSAEMKQFNYELDMKKIDLKYQVKGEVKGLSYGVIGDRLDILAHSLDDAIARAEQEGRARAKAKAQLQDFVSDSYQKFAEFYQDSYKKAKELITKEANDIVDQLHAFKIKRLEQAGLLEPQAMQLLDWGKSKELYDIAIGDSKNKQYILTMAIKKYPYNVDAIMEAIDSGYKSQGLEDLIDFLNIRPKINEILLDRGKVLFEERKKLFVSQKSNKESKEYFLSIEKDITPDQAKEILGTLVPNISQRIKSMPSSMQMDDNSNVSVLVEETLDKILDKEMYSLYIKYGVSPINNPSFPCSSYELIIDGLVFLCQGVQRESGSILAKACETIASAKTVSELEDVVQQLEKIKAYGNAKEKIAEATAKIQEIERARYDEIKSKLGKRKNIKKLKWAKLELQNLLGTTQDSIAYKEITEIDKLIKKTKIKNIAISIISVILCIILAINIAYIPLRTALDTDQFTAEFVKQKYGNLQYQIFGLQVVAEKLNDCVKQNDLPKALKIISVLAETNCGFTENDHIVGTYQFGNWLYDQALYAPGTSNVSSGYDITFKVYGYELCLMRTYKREVYRAKLYVPSVGWYEIDTFYEGKSAVFVK